MSFVTWNKKTDRIHLAMRKDMVMLAVVQPPGSEKVWMAHLEGMESHPKLRDHRIFSSVDGRFPSLEEAKDAAEDYLNRWMLAMDMTYMNPVDFDD
jgi:hypothetical protein